MHHNLCIYIHILILIILQYTLMAILVKTDDIDIHQYALKNINPRSFLKNN